MEPGNRHSTRMPLRWVWYSTPQSALAGVPSVLALAETIVAMWVYATIAVYLGTVHLTVAVLVAPLFMLRTKASVVLALRRSRLWLEKPVTVPGRQTSTAKQTFIFVAAVTSLLAFLVFPLVLIFDNDYSRLIESELVRSIILGDFFLFLFVLILGAAAILAFNIGPLFTRFLTTTICFVRRPWYTLARIPQNWKYLVVCIDSAHPPELLPGVIVREADQGVVSPLQPFGYFLARYEMWLDDRTPGAIPRLRNGSEIVLLGTRLIFAALPTYLFRWSFKGTSLLLVPLVWIVFDARTVKPEYIHKSSLMKGLYGASLCVLVVYLGLLASRLIGYDFGLSDAIKKAYDHGDPYGVLRAFVPRGELNLWQMLLLLLALITVSTYLYSERLSNRGYSVEGLSRLRNSLVLMGFVAVAMIFVSVFLSARLALTNS